ncbi:MAG TPA: MFS transporter [Candidatus Limnocylindria bacterium]|nr:MFS transporter [Candidatus Limnocylindria bacterium]
MIGAIFAAKTARTFCYGFLGILLPVYLAELGVSAVGIGVAVTLTLAGSAALTWAVRRPAERFGGRAALLALAGLTAVAACLLLLSREPWVVVFAAMVGNVAVGAGETGPFLSIEQVMIARAAAAGRRTKILSIYNLLGYAAAALGAAAVGMVDSYRVLFAVFLAAAGVQAAAYLRLPATPGVRPRGGVTAAPSTALIRKLAALFSLDSFAGGFVLQSLVAYYLHTRFALELAALGRIFFVAQMLTAVSLLLAGRLAGRFGLLNTMVVSHLVSNVLLIGVAVAPTASIAVALLFARQLLSQIDVPTRQAYVMAVVQDHEREAAATITTLWRTVAQAVTPALTGVVMQAGALGAPFVLGGGLKIVYDLLLYRTFKDVTLRSEHD